MGVPFNKNTHYPFWACRLIFAGRTPWFAQEVLQDCGAGDQWDHRRKPVFLNQSSQAPSQFCTVSWALCSHPWRPGLWGVVPGGSRTNKGWESPTRDVQSHLAWALLQVPSPKQRMPEGPENRWGSGVGPGRAKPHEQLWEPGFKGWDARGQHSPDVKRFVRN